MIEMLEALKPVLMNSTLPGGAGGVLAFLWSLRKGHYRNNKYNRKFIIEVMGGMITASFIATLFPPDYRTIAAFLIGIAWVSIIQMVRFKITAIVEAVLGEKLGK